MPLCHMWILLNGANERTIVLNKCFNSSQQQIRPVAIYKLILMPDCLHPHTKLSPSSHNTCRQSSHQTVAILTPNNLHPHTTPVAILIPNCLHPHTTPVANLTPNCLHPHTTPVSILTPHLCPSLHQTCLHPHTTPVSILTPRLSPFTNSFLC